MKIAQQIAIIIALIVFIMSGQSDKINTVLSQYNLPTIPSNITKKVDDFFGEKTEGKYEVSNGTIEVSGKCSKLLHKTGMDICFSTEEKIPLWVKYSSDKESAKKWFKRPSTFKVDKDLRRNEQGSNSYYLRSGYHKGHMKPNAIADDTKHNQLDSFLFSNIVPQNGKMNTGPWKVYEGYVRDLAKKYGKIDIITGAIPGKKYLNKGHVNIPAYMYKVIYIHKTGEVKTLLLPNDKSTPKSRVFDKRYAVPLEKIEKLSGFKFKIKKD